MSKYQAWKSFERSLVKKLESIGIKAGRMWSEQFEEGSGVDIKAGNMRIQCKYGQRPNILAAYKEAKNACKGSRELIPIAAIRKSDTGETFVTMSWKDFENLLKYADNNIVG